MRYLPINSELFIENRKRFVNLLPKNSVAIFHSNDQQPRNGDQYFPFRQQSDFFYLSGIDQEKSILLFVPDIKTNSHKEILFTLKTNEHIAIWEGHKYTKKEAHEISGIEQIEWLEEFENTLKDVLSSTKDIYLNSNEYDKFDPDVKDRDHRLGEELKKEYPKHNYHKSAPLLTKLRLIKSNEEVKLLRNACDITNKAFKRVLATIVPNKFEFEIQAEIEHVFTTNRANGHGYAPIIASGKNACILHYIENDKICKDGDLVLFDFGAEYANYSADMSRTIPVNGIFTARQKECYNAVLSVFKRAKKLYVSGTTINKINSKVNTMMEQQMIKLGLITNEDIKNQDKENPAFKKYYMHGTAHFLGLDVHDVGDKDQQLKAGMVLTCEPGLYILEENIGIRIENNILVTNSSPIDLMEDIPIEIEEIEKLMQFKTNEHIL
ncbi:MAG: aminopeptidase P N-terminal domain-containing protein [Bacteroidota bacterium]